MRRCAAKCLLRSARRSNMDFMRTRPIRRVAWVGATAVFLALGGLAFAADEEARLLPDGPGKDLVGRLCFDCHGAGNFRKVRLNRDDWSDQVADMVDRGAKANEAEMAAIVDYLTQNFGKDSKINVNTAPLVELKVILGLSVKESQAVIDYREANGKFQALPDLQKVPGMDGKKIEAKKDMIAF
jgi:competence ComEA-like helix-hairpin-helix protein